MQKNTYINKSRTESVSASLRNFLILASAAFILITISVNGFANGIFKTFLNVGPSDTTDGITEVFRTIKEESDSFFKRLIEVFQNDKDVYAAFAVSKPAEVLHGVEENVARIGTRTVDLFSVEYMNSLIISDENTFEAETRLKAVKAERAAAFAGTLSLDFTIQRPIEGKITSAYGYRVHPIYKNYSFHTGVDIGGNPDGTEIKSAGEGKVITAAYSSVYGNYVVISHKNNIQSMYAHCRRILVREGENVAAGEKIAEVGSTGWSTGPHLHFELRYKGETLDPELYVMW